MKIPGADYAFNFDRGMAEASIDAAGEQAAAMAASCGSLIQRRSTAAWCAEMTTRPSAAGAMPTQASTSSGLIVQAVDVIDVDGGGAGIRVRRRHEEITDEKDAERQRCPVAERRRRSRGARPGTSTRTAASRRRSDSARKCSGSDWAPQHVVGQHADDRVAHSILAYRSATRQSLRRQDARQKQASTPAEALEPRSQPASQARRGRRNRRKLAGP